MLAPRHRQSHAKEHAAKLRLLHPRDEIRTLFQRHASLRNSFRTDFLILDHRTQDRDQFKVLTRTNLQEDVGGFGALRRADINQHDRPILPAIGQELALGHQRVLRKMPGVALRGIASPVNNKIASVLHFTERTSDFATQLGSDFRGTVSQRCVTVQQTTQQVRQGHTLALCFAGCIAHPVDQRHVGLVQVRRGDFDGFVERRFFAIDQSIGILAFGGMVKKPSRPQHARLFRFDNADVVGVQLDIVTDTATERTRRVIYDSESHRISR